MTRRWRSSSANETALSLAQGVERLSEATDRAVAAVPDWQ
jgi:hypothetical protein